ncbi:SubName: Full=Uncharacterized protein {ECO:0000313/EMBL:CCA69269.1} [Serendipita indica DSM 11827]|uniref:DUF6593 domain-containing protein n=1 Tax=Serendipita indica (strain DSM 11827) TaxID=1109443 RepID=G4TDA7_SERID|nr:SubName: Full=Uncharacterized protein {ECO:0000313/EMBL:CCA69269.1} [Serendipita indica DSM 11827]CCA69269.1 hypothetical protein PIIN_03168 [Serendipita indica DSM 11827]
MSDIFTCTYAVDKQQKRQKDVLLLDGDTPKYGIIREDGKGKIAKIVKYDGQGGKIVLAEVQWVRDREDKIRFLVPGLVVSTSLVSDADDREPSTSGAGTGNSGVGDGWIKLDKAWKHYNITKDKEVFLSSFIGADSRTYVWHLRGAIKVLSRDDKSGPVVAKHVDHSHGGTLEVRDEATEERIGDMLFITFLASEGFRGRTRFSWANAFSAPGFFG